MSVLATVCFSFIISYSMTCLAHPPKCCDTLDKYEFIENLTKEDDECGDFWEGLLQDERWGHGKEGKGNTKYIGGKSYGILNWKQASEILKEKNMVSKSAINALNDCLTLQGFIAEYMNDKLPDPDMCFSQFNINSQPFVNWVDPNSIVVTRFDTIQKEDGNCQLYRAWFFFENKQNIQNIDPSVDPKKVQSLGVIQAIAKNPMFLTLAFVVKLDSSNKCNRLPSVSLKWC